ncbi:MAG: ComF family protein [Candidatus Bathyarchaeia archaeon]
MTSVWKCCLNGNEIKVACRDQQYGSYKLLTKPYCMKCAFPGVNTSECRWHSDDYGFNRIHAMGKYISTESQEGWNDLLSKHIRGLKKYPGYSEPLGEAISLCIQNEFTELKQSDFLVPVPKHPKEMENNYNQAETLTSVVSSILGIPAAGALIKVKPLKLMLTSRSSRKESVKGAYAFSENVSLNGKCMILIDDVTTSGSTASECARVLVDAGAKTVNVVVAGRDVFVD